MYCVIQEVRRKKPDPYGEQLEIRAYQNQWRLDENKPYTWAYEYSEERFERPHLEAYKITLHQSYREGGAVRKRQYAVCTMSYYDICESWWGDCIVGGEKALAEKVGMDAAELYEIIEAKLGPCGSVWRPIFTSPSSIRPNRNTSGSWMPTEKPGPPFPNGMA